MTTDEKWEAVKKYYERGKTKFKVRPDDKKIEILYNEMLRLKATFEEHFEMSRGVIRKFIEWKPDDKN